MMCIVNYIIQFFTKHAMAQKVFEDRNWVFSSFKVTVKFDNSKSLLVNNKSNLHGELISAEFLSNTENNIPMIYSSKMIKKAFYKCK